MLTALALFLTPAQAGDIIVMTHNPHSRDLTDYSDCCDDDCSASCEDEDEDEEHDCDDDDDDGRCERHSFHDWDGPDIAVMSSETRSPQLRARYAMHFLPQAPAHYIGVRHTGEKDAYLNAEIRYMPANDLLWTGRAGAGVDVFGGGNWDLTLGLFIGTNGEWERSDEARVLYAAPMGGTEIGFGIEGDRLFAKYRWLAGLGSGPLDDALTENELTVGYKVTDTLHAFGQWIVVNPGAAERSGGIGLGVQAVF